MGKPSTDHRGYPRVSLGVIDQRVAYQRLIEGARPYLTGGTFYTMGANQIFIRPSDFRSQFFTKQRVMIVNAAGGIIYRTIATTSYNGAASPPFTSLVLSATIPSSPTPVAAYIYQSLADGWVALATYLDEDMVAIEDALESAADPRADLLARVNAVITNEGVASRLLKPPAEFWPLFQPSPRALTPLGPFSNMTIDDGGSGFAVLQFGPGDYSGFFRSAQQLRFHRAGGGVFVGYVEDSGFVPFDTDPYPATNFTEVVIRDLTGSASDVNAIDVSRVLWDISPLLTLDMIPDGLITAEKCLPRIAHQGTMASIFASLNGIRATLQARVTEQEATFTTHISNPVVHGAAGPIISAQGVNARITTHDEDPLAHTLAGGAFANIQRRNQRGIPGGFVPLDAAGQIDGSYLPGPYGVKRVINGTVAISASLLTASAIIPELTATPLTLSRSFVTMEWSTTSGSNEAAGFPTLALNTDGVTAQRDAAGETITIWYSIVEFY